MFGVSVAKVMHGNVSGLIFIFLVIRIALRYRHIDINVKW